MNELEELLTEKASKFLDEIFSELSDKEIDVSTLYLDHICYRVESVERYSYWKKVIEQGAILLSEDMVSGRLISNFKFSHPIIYKQRSISVLELPSPKLSSFYHEGFEHLEFVVPFPLEIFIAEHSHLDFDIKGLNKDINREIRLALGNSCVKFHEQSLEEIIEIEQKIKRGL